MSSLPRASFGALIWVCSWWLSTTEARAQANLEAANRQYSAAFALQQRGAYDLATDEWIKFINTYQTDARLDRAFFHLGVCYLQNKHLDQALQCFETVVKTYPKSELMEATYLYLGATQFKLAQAGKAEMFNAAAVTFESLVKNHPKGKYVAQALFNRGDCFYNQNKKSEAAGLYKQVLGQSPDDKLLAETLYALGVTQEELNQHADAGKTYDEFLAKFAQSPLAAEVVMRRGETLFAAGQFEAAAEWFAAAAQRQGFAMADHATLRQADSLVQSKKYAEAAELYASIPAKFPKSAHVATATTACHALARNLIKQHKPTEALAVIEKALPAAGQGPHAPALLMDQADAIFEIPERRAEATALYAALAAKYPRDAVAPQSLYMAGYAALAQSDYQGAAKQADAFLAAHADHELTPDVTYVSAESKLQLGKFPEAEKLYTQLLDKYPKHADADFWKVRRGTSLHLQKKYPEVIASLQPILAGLRNPDALAEAQFLIGSSLAEQGQFPEAAKSLEASLAAQRKWRQADEVLLVLAQVYHRQNNDQKARDTIRRLVSEFPNSKLLDRAQYRLAEYSAGANDPMAAATEYQRVIEKWPQSALVPHALYGLGWALFDQNKFDEAEKTFDELLAKHAGHKLAVRARYGRGMARQQLGRFAEAVGDIQALLKAEPGAAEKSDAQYVLGLCQVGLKKPTDAAATFQALLRDDPKYAAADKVLYELAWALKSQGKEKEAVASFTQLCKDYSASPRVAESQFHIGEATYKEGKFQEAATAYHAAMAKAGKSDLGEKAAHKLGWAYYRLDNPTEAQQTFAYQRTTWPNGPLSDDAAFMEAECLFKEKKFKEALAAYRQVKKTSSKEFQTLILLHSAQSLGQMKQWDESIKLLDQCVQDYPDSTYIPEALYEKGWALQSQGKMDEALALYELVIAKSNQEAAARAQFMIGEIQFQQKKHAEAVKSFFKVTYGYGYPQWQADAAYEAARCFEVLNKKSQAIKQYQELIDKFPQSDKVTLAKQRVKALQE